MAEPPSPAAQHTVDAPTAPIAAARRWRAHWWYRASARIMRFLREYPYVGSCVGVTLLFLGIAQSVSLHIGVPIRDPEGTLLGRRMVGPVLLMGLFALVESFRRAWLMRRAGTTTPLLRLTLVTFRERWWWKRLAIATVGFLCFAFTYLAYRNLKSFVSLVDYRIYDPELLAMDRWLLVGHDPAIVLHDMLGRGVARRFLAFMYLIYIPLVPVTVSIALAFIERLREAFVFVATYMWCWILGTASYYAIPTLGPFFSRPELFDDLPPSNITRLQNALIEHRLQLHSDNLGDNVVGGIAGFASLHVGIVVAAALLMRYHRQRTLEIIAWLYLVPVTLATSYFGWHFLADDVAGLFLGWLALALGRITVHPHVLAVWRRRARRELDEHLHHQRA